MKQLSNDAVNWVEIGEGAAGQRVDNFLLGLLKGVPKSHIYRILRSGEVRVNSGRVDATVRLAVGDRVRIPPLRLPAAGAASATAIAPRIRPVDLPVLFEDEWLLAVDKPAGLAVHGGSGVAHGVIEQLRHERPDQPFLELVHRLDRETSGVLLLAKKRSALVGLHAQIRDGTTDKRYATLVRGRWPHLRREVRVSLHKYVTADGERRVRPDPAGQEAITVFTRKRVWSHVTLLEARLKTGRTHQIRVHLAHEGYPIAGDDKYGDFEWNKLLGKQGLKRMFLHAAHFGCTHPHTGAPLTIVAPLATELQRHLANLGEPEPAR